MSALCDAVRAEIAAHDREPDPFKWIRARNALDMHDRQARRFAVQQSIGMTVMAGHLYLDRAQLEALAEANRVVETKATPSNDSAASTDGLEHWTRQAASVPRRRTRSTRSGE